MVGHCGRQQLLEVGPGLQPRQQGQHRGQVIAAAAAGPQALRQRLHQPLLQLGQVRHRQHQVHGASGVASGPLGHQRLSQRLSEQLLEPRGTLQALHSADHRDDAAVLLERGTARTDGTGGGLHQLPLQRLVVWHRQGQLQQAGRGSSGAAALLLQALGHRLGQEALHARVCHSLHQLDARAGGRLGASLGQRLQPAGPALGSQQHSSAVCQRLDSAIQLQPPGCCSQGGNQAEGRSACGLLQAPLVSAQHQLQRPAARSAHLAGQVIAHVPRARRLLLQLHPRPLCLRRQRRQRCTRLLQRPSCQPLLQQAGHSLHALRLSHGQRLGARPQHHHRLVVHVVELGACGGW